jgi:diacylglycerol kinase family enzyme
MSNSNGRRLEFVIRTSSFFGHSSLDFRHSSLSLFSGELRLVSADICVIFNAVAGRGRAAQRIESLRRTLGTRAQFLPTRAPAHGEELAFDAAKKGFAIVAAAGGDGTVHEVANGLLRAARPEVALAVFPAGSANDYAHSLGLAPGWWLKCDPTAHARTVDAGLARTRDGRERYFVNGVGAGFNGAVTLESQRIGRLQGVWLYSLALFRAFCHRFTAPVMTIEIDDCTRLLPTLALSVAIGRREGNFVLAPDAVVDDGLFDYLHVGRLRRWELFRYFPGMISGNLPTEHPEIRRGRCRKVCLQAEAPLIVHLDGELFSRPEDELRDLNVRILPGALRVQTCASG